MHPDEQFRIRDLAAKDRPTADIEARARPPAEVGADASTSPALARIGQHSSALLKEMGTVLAHTAALADALQELLDTPGGLRARQRAIAALEQYDRLNRAASQP